MKIVEIECKRFSEWDKITQEKILDKHRDINVDHEWWDGTYEYWAEKLIQMGFDVTETKFKDEYKWNPETSKREKTGGRVKYTDYLINFSGFYSQGDGASFTGQVDILKWLKFTNNPKYARIVKLLESGALECSGNIKRNKWHRYVHWNTTTLYLNWEERERRYVRDELKNINYLLGDIENDCFKHHQDLNKEIYAELEKEYDYLTSNRVVGETLETNEYDFDDNGKIW